MAHTERGGRRRASGRNSGSNTIGAIAALGLVGAPTAASLARLTDAADAAEVRCVQAGGAKVERRRGGEADIVARLTKGAEVTVLEARDGQSRIRYRFDGHKRVGWTESESLGSCTLPPTPTTVPAAPPPAPGGGHTLSAFSAGQMRAHYINVGQGVATLYEFSCGAVLIDTGGDNTADFDGDRALTHYLDGFFEDHPELNRTLDLLVISHPHIDHAHGAAVVTDEYTVKNVVTGGVVKNPITGHFYSGGDQQEKLEAWARAHAKLETVEAKDVPKGGKTSAVIDPVACSDEDPKIRVLWGTSKTQPSDWSRETFEEANNHSVVVRVDYGKASFLTTGDLETDAAPAVIALHDGSGALDADVWEVSHHGSKNGANQAVLDAITPEIALLGTGDPTKPCPRYCAFAYGHPRENIIDQLLHRITRPRTEISAAVALGVKEFENIPIKKAIFATSWDGSVVVTAKADGTYRVTTEK